MMDQLHRIAWMSRVTHVRGHGDWLRITLAETQSLADTMNEAYGPDLVHWAESAWGEGGRLTPASGRVRGPVPA